MSNTNFTKSLTKIIMYILFAVLILGLLGGVIYLLNSPNGMYVVYGEQNITSDNSGITVEWTSEGSEVTFTIQNTEDWGAYSVEDCTVKVVPNVTSGRDFDFTVNGETNLYSQVSDLTAAFVKNYSSYDGNGLTVNSDGEFSLYLIAYTSDYLTTAMPTILKRVYGSTVTINEDYGDIDILSYPYFALQVTSPDGDTVISIVIQLYVNSYTVSYNLTGVTGKSNPDTITKGDSATLQFTVQDGYYFPDTITVTGATLVSWNSSTGVAVISNVTNAVTVTVTALRQYTINYQLSNVTAESYPATIMEGETLVLTFTATDGYYLLSDITVTGVGSYIWNLSTTTTGSLTLINPTGDVTITYSADKEITYTLSGVWLFKDSFGSSDISKSFSFENVDEDGNSKFAFTSGGVTYNKISVNGNTTNVTQINYTTASDTDTDTTVEVYSSADGWADSDYRTITFASEQTVSESLYNFVTTYADHNLTYTVTIDDTYLDYITVSPLVSGNVIGYIEAGGSLTITITADDDYYVTMISVENATLYDEAGKKVSDGVIFISGGSGAISYTFTVCNPTDDVITITAITSRSY